MHIVMAHFFFTVHVIVTHLHIKHCVTLPYCRLKVYYQRDQLPKSCAVSGSVVLIAIKVHIEVEYYVIKVVHYSLYPRQSECTYRQNSM